MAGPSIINLNNATPAAPAGFKNVTWQGDSNNPRNVSSYIDGGYRIIFSYPGPPLNAYTFQVIAFDIGVTFPANFGAAPVASVGFCNTNPAATATYTFKKNHSGTVTTIGTAAISTAGAFTFATTGGTAQTFVAGDVLSILSPATDLTLSDVTINLVGYKT